MPAWPDSNGVRRKLPLRGPVSLTVIMSQTPLLGSPAASCALRSAIDRCAIAALPKVIGFASSAVGPAELASGVKSSKLVLAALAMPADAAVPASTRLPATVRPRVCLAMMMVPYVISPSSR